MKIEFDADFWYDFNDEKSKVFQIFPDVYEDERGKFLESWKFIDEDKKDVKDDTHWIFKENWITILGIDSADDEYDDVTVEEIYDALMISQYYKSDIPDDIGEIFNWTPDKIRETLPKLTSSMKTSVIIRANELIENGTLDSISRVKAIEESLNCVLASPKDN